MMILLYLLFLCCKSEQTQIVPLFSGIFSITNGNVLYGVNMYVTDPGPLLKIGLGCSTAYPTLNCTVPLFSCSGSINNQQFEVKNFAMVSGVIGPSQSTYILGSVPGIGSPPFSSCPQEGGLIVYSAAYQGSQDHTPAWIENDFQSRSLTIWKYGGSLFPKPINITYVQQITNVGCAKCVGHL